MTASGFERVRHVAGPIVTRTCLRGDTGYHWVEQTRRGAAGCLDAAQVAVLRGALGDAPGRAYPVVRSRDLALWPDLPSARLLSDRFLNGDLAGDDEYWRMALPTLGGVAGQIHAVPVTDELRRALPVRVAPPWLEDRQVAAEVRQVRESLPAGLAPELAAAAEPKAAEPKAAEPKVAEPEAAESEAAESEAAAHRPAENRSRCETVVHGRFSAGVCSAEEYPRVLGWREAGIGDPLGDLAYFMADLVEAACATRCPVEVAALRIEQFLGGYHRSLDLAESAALWALVARRIIEHFSLGIWATRKPDGINEVLPATERYWVAVRALCLEGCHGRAQV